MNEHEVCFPCQMHDHFREDELLASIAEHQWLAEYSMIMPNLRKPILDIAAKHVYLAQLRLALRRGWTKPLMTCQLTPSTPLAEIEQSNERDIFAWKGYSRGVTTNSDYGIEDWHCHDMHERAALAGKVGVPILLHLQDKTPDPLDGEVNAFLRALPLIEKHPETLWSIEHASCAETLEIIESLQERGYRITATLALHHAIRGFEDVNANPLLKVQPPLQTEENMNAVLDAILSGKYIKGRDAAAHPVERKAPPWDNAASGIWTPDEVDIPLTYQLFREHGGKRWSYYLTRFMSSNTHIFYGDRMPPRNLPPLRLIEEEWQVDIETSPIKVIPFMAGEILRYKLAN